MAKQSNSATSDDIQKKTDEALEKESAKTKNTDSSNEQSLDLTEEQWSEVFKSPRFKELNDRAKEAESKLAEAEKIKEKEIQKKLKEEGKLEELLEEKDKEIEKLTSTLTSVKLKSEIVSVASKLKVVDTEVVEKLIDRDKLELDKEGNYTNVEDVVQGLLSEKPYLAGAESNTSSSIGSNANATTSSQNGDFVITKTELREKSKDHSWYTEHKEDIDQWTKEGRIDYSR
jgi:hypothetical protein